MAPQAAKFDLSTSFLDIPKTPAYGLVRGGALGTFYVYADDPGYGGGAVTCVAATAWSTTFAANGRIFFGKITTVGGGGGAVGSDGGGSGGGRFTN
jgi:hypothetical protein